MEQERVDTESDILASGAGLAQELASANGFTAEELAENRAGRIAPAQIRRLWSAALDPVRTSLSALIGWLLFLLVVKTFVPWRMLALLESALGMSLVVLFAIITVSTAFAFLWQLLTSFEVIFNLVRDIISREAAMREGHVSASSAAKELHGMAELYDESGEQFYYAIGTEYLVVGEDGHHVLRPYSGSTFRVFMTPRGKLLLSIEPVKIRRTDRLLK